MTSIKSILVTGSHRSGSTWVGKMISTSPSIVYIHEPFNLVGCRPGICGARFVHWFTYITHENETIFYKHFRNTIEFRYNLIEELKAIKTRGDIKRILKEYVRFSTYRFRNITPLIKDPIAIFSTEWLAKTFKMDVLVLIRHPAAFVSSLKRLNWTHPFSHFLEQPLLMRDHLYPFESEITEYANQEHDIIDQASLLWRIIYYVVSEYRKSHKDWVFLRHEDISRDPLRHFQDLFATFNLDFSPHVAAVIQEYTDSSNPSEAPASSSTLCRRDSKANIWNWKHRLTESEISRIRESVEDVSQEFYSDGDW